MTRAAAESGLYRIVDDIADAVHAEFDAVRALRRGRSGGMAGAVVNELVKRNRLLDRYVVQPEVQRHRENARRQLTVMLDCLVHDESIEDYRDVLLDADLYYTELDPDTARETREAVAEAVVSRYRTAREHVAPVVESSEADFWPAVTATLSREQAHDLVRANFSFAEEMRTYREAFSFSTRLDPGDLLGRRTPLPTIAVEYTDESLRAMGRAETRVRRALDREIERRYAE